MVDSVTIYLDRSSTQVILEISIATWEPGRYGRFDTWDMEKRGRFDLNVAITTHSLSVRYASRLFRDELERFQNELKRLNTELTGNCECEFQDGVKLQLEFTDNRGHLQATLSIGDVVRYPPFALDQTYLAPAIEEIERILALDAKLRRPPRKKKNKP